MTAVSMDIFVRDLFSKTKDFAALSQRRVREAYMKHMGMSELSEEHKDLLKQIVTVLVSEMNALKEEETADSGDDIDSDDEKPTKRKQESSSKMKKKKVANSKKRKGEKSASRHNDYSDDDEEVTEVAVPQKKRCRLVSDSESEESAGRGSDDDEEGVPLAALKKKLGDTKDQAAVDDTSVNSDNEDDNGNKRTGNENKARSRSLDSDSDSTEDMVKKSKRKEKREKSKKGLSVKNDNSKESIKSPASSLNDSDASDDDSQKSSSTSEAKNSKTKQSKAAQARQSSSERDPRLVQLEKIAKHCGVYPRGKNHTTTFQNCSTDKQKCERIKQLLRDAGMEGPPSMKAAEKLKLDKETKELNQQNIIASEGRTKRNVFSIYSRNEYKPVGRPPSPTLKKSFSNLRGIIDSDGDSD